MSRNLPTPSAVPLHWTPDEALAIFEFVDMLRDQIWDRYGPDIQDALRVQTGSHDPRQLQLPDIEPDQPF